MAVAIVQARMRSTRLPGKVLASLAGRPLLDHVIERVLRANTIEGIVVATSVGVADDAVEALCRRRAVPCYRGSGPDVLDRYYQAARRSGADPVVRITADCPLIDPDVIDRVVGRFTAGGSEYVSNIEPPTYPDGLDVEICAFEALARAWTEATRASDREHVTLYIRRHPDRFRCANVRADADWSRLRWVVDEAADLAFVRAVYAHLGTRPFGMGDVLALLREYPALAAINAGIGRNEGLVTSLRAEGAL